ITEYLVNISKRRAFWSLNEDILKITILTTNTPYPSRKIRRIRACTHQRPRRKQAQYAISREDQYDRVKLLIEGSELSLQEKELKLYNEVDTLTSDIGEMIHSYYLRFAQLMNDMNTIRLSMKPLQVSMKYVNHLEPEWSKFITDVKLAKDVHNTNFDQLYTYLRGNVIRIGVIQNTGNATANQSKVIRCYSCIGEGHIARELMCRCE
ncbi:hypothetical protein Tco_0555464, partial [Tanacetum coccineum]